VVRAFVSAALTILVLIGTIVLVVTRPRGLSEGIAATAGTIAVLLVGTATLGDVWQGIVGTAPVLIFLIAMMFVATIAEDAGCFEWAAERAVAWSRNDGRLLFVNLYALGALVTIFLSLDVTAIVLAPIVCALIRRTRLSPLPYVVSCAYVANTASLFLPVSNLTNMLAYSLLAMPFNAFVRVMTLPNLAAMCVNLLVFFVLFRRNIPIRFEPYPLPVLSSSEFDQRRLRRTAAGLVAVVIALLVFGALGWPLYIPAVAGALLLAPPSLLLREIDANRLVRSVAWALPLFVVGMYTILVGADRAGLGVFWRSFVAGAAADPGGWGYLKIAVGTAISSNLVNNLPTALVMITSLGAVVPPATRSALAFASLVGTNVGSNVTVFGSLATMLVLGTARRYGIQVSAFQYVGIGLVTVPLMVLTATLVLWGGVH